MSKTKAPPSALELEQEYIEESRNAHLKAGDATKALHEAREEVTAANDAAESALDDVVRGVEGADERHSAAISRQYAAQEQLARVEPQIASCDRVLRSAREKLRQLRETALDELADEANEWTADAEAARDELRPALEKYLQTWQRAESRWHQLLPGVRARVLQEDREHGWIRADSRVSRDCRVPECPIEATVLDAIAKVSPRPPAMSENYDPDPFAQPEEITPPPPMIDGVPITFADNPLKEG